ncbi:HD domain-containing protein [bacterium]|nr:HD domain-containing protein [bacterium]
MNYFSISYKALRNIYPEKNPSPVFRHCLKVFQIVKILSKKLDIQKEILYLGALLHDIGRMADIHHPMLHAVEGEKIILQSKIFDFMDQETRNSVSKICRNHIGCGITAVDIENQKLPLPISDYIPETTSELLVSFADNICSGDKITGINHAVTRYTNELGKEYGNKILDQCEQLKVLGIDLSHLY